jgi:4-hydroxy-tetrahydrodipicolinate synthase
MVPHRSVVNKGLCVRASNDFSGLWIPLVTPFLHGAVDHPALTRLVTHLCGTGIAGFVACGSTGEAAALDAKEQQDVLKTVLQAAQGLPVVMGLSGYHLPKMLDAVRTLDRQPLAGLLVAAPCYIRPSQAGLLRWFTDLADASALPLIVYDIPYRTGATLELSTLLQLAQHPRICAVKDCGGDATKTASLIASGALQVLAGEDAQIFSTLAQGGAGAIAASAHGHTQRFVAVMQAIARNDLPAARKLWQPMLPWIAGQFAEPNPGPIKGWLARHGQIQAELRAPMTQASSALIDKLIALEQGFAALRPL